LELLHLKFVLLAAALFAVPFLPRSQKPAEQRTSVRIATVRTGTIESTLRVNGILSTKDAVTLLAPRLPGRRDGDSRAFMMTLQQMVKPGARVLKGEVVGAFDPQYVQVRIGDRRADIVQRERTLRRLRADLDVKLENHRQQLKVAKGALEKSALDLKSIPVRSGIQAEILRLRHEEASAHYERLLREVPLVEASEKAALRIEELRVEDLMLELRRDEANLQRMQILAPIGGIVVPQQVRRGSDMGEVEVGDELRSGQPFVKVVDTRALMVEAWVNQVDVERVRLGAKAKIEFDALPGIALPGKVTAVGAVPAGSRYRPDYLKQLPVRVELDGADERVFPNASASADIVLASEEASAIVPRACVFDSGSGSPRAFVRAGNGWEERELVLGLGNHIEVAVLEGLSEGDTVAAEEVVLK
jgi:multidrug efflux pump subunit AcrA (membrane-fusion protein)